jgi:hypothetical protein
MVLEDGIEMDNYIEMDEPAVIMANGDREWYQNGQLHREGNEPAVIRADGTREWYRNGEFIR